MRTSPARDSSRAERSSDMTSDGCLPYSASEEGCAEQWEERGEEG